MALLDFLKKKKDVEMARTPEKKEEKASAIKKPAVTKVKKEEKKEKTAQSSMGPIKTSGFSFETVREPHISEKASYLSEKDHYTFKVSPNYNKKEVKKAVEGIYGVNVLSVNIIKIPAKKRRLVRIEGFKGAYVKAVVKIKKGQKIEIL